MSTQTPTVSSALHRSSHRLLPKLGRIPRGPILSRTSLRVSGSVWARARIYKTRPTPTTLFEYETFSDFTPNGGLRNLSVVTLQKRVYSVRQSNYDLNGHSRDALGKSMSRQCIHACLYTFTQGPTFAVLCFNDGESSDVSLWGLAPCDKYVFVIHP